VKSHPKIIFYKLKKMAKIFFNFKKCKFFFLCLGNNYLEIYLINDMVEPVLHLSYEESVLAGISVNFTKVFKLYIFYLILSS
jgi:hypothetical protein